MRKERTQTDEIIADLEALDMDYRQGRRWRYLGVLVTALAFLVGFLAPF